MSRLASPNRGERSRDDELESHVSVSTFPDAPSYAFDNDDLEAGDRHNYLSDILDGPTTARLSELGDLTGRRCLEIGAGGGSIARWLAAQVGPTGQVLATDINPRHISADAGFSIIHHDVTTDPIPEGPWDLIHSRLVLLHLPQREEILTRLAAALAPGGALMLEEWETTFRKIVLTAPDAASAELLQRYQDLLVERILIAKGNDPTWASRVHSAMVEAGLTNVDTNISAESWPGGTAGAMLIAVNIGQLRDEFMEVGVTAEELDEICRLVSDPRVVVRGHLLYSTVGRRPMS